MNKNYNDEPIVDYYERKKGIFGIFSPSFENENYSDYSNSNSKKETVQTNPYAIPGYEQDGETDIETTLTYPPMLKEAITVITVILAMIIMLVFIIGIFSAALESIEDAAAPDRTSVSVQTEFAYQNHTEEEIKILAETAEFEHEDVIKIPTLYKHSKYAGVEEYIHKIENNEVADDSIVVKVKYMKNTKSNSLINDFTNKLVKLEGYEIKTGISKTKKILIRKEFDEYFTYIIIDNNVITYGLGKEEKGLLDYLYEAFDNFLEDAYNIEN